MCASTLGSVWMTYRLKKYFIWESDEMEMFIHLIKCVILLGSAIGAIYVTFPGEKAKLLLRFSRLHHKITSPTTGPACVLQHGD